MRPPRAARLRPARLRLAPPDELARRYGLHHTLTHALSESLSSSLTAPTMHYYYCVYCYYYGNFCDICFQVSDSMLLGRQWWLGSTTPGAVS